MLAGVADARRRSGGATIGSAGGLKAWSRLKTTINSPGVQNIVTELLCFYELYISFKNGRKAGA